MKQTAVEWLMYQMLAASINKETEEMHITLPKDVFNQAKAMEKEQIKDAYNSDRPNLCAFTEGTAFKEYYKKTFKKK